MCFLEGSLHDANRISIHRGEKRKAKQGDTNVRGIGSSEHAATYLSSLRHCSDIQGEVVSRINIWLISRILGAFLLDSLDRGVRKLG